MELLSFDLVWLARPIDECPSGEGFIEGREAELRVEGPTPVTYAAWLGYCADDEQWYGLQEMLDQILTHEAWTYDDVEGFAIDGVPVSTGVQVGFQQNAISWADFKEQAAQVASQHRAPPPEAAAVRALDQRPTTWELAWRPVGWVREADEPASLIYASVIHDATGYLRTASLYSNHPPTGEQLEELVRRAAGTPDAPGVPLRPSTLRLADAAVADALVNPLAALGIQVETAATPQADEALDQLVDHLTPDLPPAFLTGAPDDAVRAFFETATDFYAARPWHRFEDHKYLGFQFDDGPWHYASVMGQLEEAPGLALFDDWLQLCRFHHNQASFFTDMMSDLTGEPPALSSLEAAGAAEAMTLDALTTLHPTDAACVQRLGIEPLRDDEYPLPYRYDADAGYVPPRFSLADYRALMRAILVALERRRATPVTSIKTTLDLDGRQVRLRYPADGTERPPEGPAGLRLVIEGRDADPDPTALPEGLNLHVDAVGATPFEAIARALKEVDDDFQYVGVGADEVVLWDDRGRRKSPCPQMADLIALDDLWVEVLFTAFPARIEPLEDAPDAVRVQLVEA